MDVISLSLLILSSTVIGILIGGVGIGGVLLVPILTYVLKIDIHVAIATAILSYVVSGAIGTWVFALNSRHMCSISWYFQCLSWQSEERRYHYVHKL